MTRLEQLGLEVAGERLFHGDRGLSRLLAALVLAAPRTVSRLRLTDAVVQRPRDLAPTSTSVSARICLLRDRLEDLGYPRSIIKNDFGQGYSITAADAETLINALKDAA